MGMRRISDLGSPEWCPDCSKRLVARVGGMWCPGCRGWVMEYAGQVIVLRPYSPSRLTLLKAAS